MRGIAEYFNKFFTEIGPTLAKGIDPSSVTFENYLKALYTNQTENNINELKDAFFVLKLIKSPGYNEINFNTIQKCFETSHKPLLHIVNFESNFSR